MKKGQLYEGIVTGVDFPNRGNVELEGERVIVRNTIPGQKISYAISKIRSSKSEGIVKEVLEKSPLETREQACRSFGYCGGCSYQTMAYESQLTMKREQVKRLLDQVCKEYTFEGILGSPVEWGYRNKMEFSFGDEFKDGPLSLGLHKKGSFHDVITADDCAIVDQDFNRILSCVLEYAAGLGARYYHKLTHIGYLRHLLVRKAAKTGEILVDIVTTTQEEGVDDKSRTSPGAEGMTGKGTESVADKGTEDITDIGTEKMAGVGMENGSEAREGIDCSGGCGDCRGSMEDIFDPLVNRLLDLPLRGKIAGILHTYNDSQADVVKSDRTVLLYGRDYIYEELLGLRFQISAFSFFQTNSLGAEVLYSKVREYAGETKDKRIFDLYSGTGTIAQLLAPVASKVTGVEIVEEAVEAAKGNAALNGLDNCEFIAGDVLKVIDTLEDKPDIIVLDPPRDGIHPKALDKIIAFGVDKIVYISCKPTSLARDLDVLQAKGYAVEKVCCVDLFPQTTHVETVVLLSHKKQIHIST